MIKIMNYKALTFLLVLCVYTTSLSAQTVYSNKEYSRFGIAIGLTSSNLYNDTVGYASGILFNGGFFYNLSLNDKLNVGLELLYSGKSVKKESPIIKYRFYYVDIPLFIQYKFSENIRAEIGVQYSKYINSKFLYIDGSKKSGMHVQSLSSNIDNEYSMLLGAEFDVLKDFKVGARYTYSLKPFIGKALPYFGVFQFTLGYVVNRSNKQIFGKKEIN